MPIFFAGVPLVMDFDNQIQDFLDRFSPLDSLRLFGSAPVAVNDRDSLPGNPAKQSVRLSVPNWSDPPPLRLNQLQWPCTGATRWARFVGFVDEPRLDKIIQSIGYSAFNQNDKHGALIISEGVGPGGVASSGAIHRNRYIEPVMYMLPPRPVAVDTRAGAIKGYLLPLVDERYLWQRVPVTSVQLPMTFGTYGSTFTWANFFSTGSGAPGSGLGTWIPFHGGGFDSDTPHADYFKPDALSFDTDHENAPIVLDAAAGSVGMRVVFDFAGRCFLMNYSRSASRLQDSLAPSADLNESGYEIIAGGPINKYNAMRIPGRVYVLFPKQFHNGGFIEWGSNWNDAGNLDPATLVSSWFKVIYTTAEVEVSDSTGPWTYSTTDLETLTKKIASDFFNWQTQHYDYTFDGLKKWKPNGYDDWIIISHADHTDKGGLLTRVFSHPEDFGTQHQYQSFRFSASRGTIEVRFASIISPSSVGASGTLVIQNSDGDDSGYSAPGPGGEITIRSAGFYRLDLCGMLVGPQLVSGTFDVLRLMSDKTGAWAALDPYAALSFIGRDSGSDYQLAPHVQSLTRYAYFDAGDKLRVDVSCPSGGGGQIYSLRLLISPDP